MGYVEYYPKTGDRVKLSSCAMRYIDGDILVFRDFYYPGDDVIGTCTKSHIDISPPGTVCEMECHIDCDNGSSGQYPMSFLDEA